MVSGLDLIEMMIRVAEGEVLPPQESVVLTGHSIECRITAEDPIKFLPSPGKNHSMDCSGRTQCPYRHPCACGLYRPSTYDSMIGKLIVYGKDRNEAIARMHRALSEFTITGFEQPSLFI
jgi:acetyl-CoA carboxylase, biotin carboxylase subunit